MIVQTTCKILYYIFKTEVIFVTEELYKRPFIRKKYLKR